MNTGVSVADASFCLGILRCTTAAVIGYIVSHTFFFFLFPHYYSHGRMSCHGEFTFRGRCDTE